MNYAPTNTQVQALATTPPTLSGGTSSSSPAAGTNSGYTIVQQAVRSGTVDAGKYAGLKGNITPYVVTATAKSATGAEVSLQRIVDAVAIPVFQFGIFSDTDLSFFAGPQFNFGGKVHTNGNLYLAKGTARIGVPGSRDGLRRSDPEQARERVSGGRHRRRQHLHGEMCTPQFAIGFQRRMQHDDRLSRAVRTELPRLGTDEGSMTGGSLTTFDSPLSYNTNWPGTTGISNSTYAGWIKNGRSATTRTARA